MHEKHGVIDGDTPTDASPKPPAGVKTGADRTDPATHPSTRAADAAARAARAAADQRRRRQHDEGVSHR